MRCIWPALLFLAGCASAPDIPKGQIVSNNPCVDAVLAHIAAPGQVAAVSSWSHDPKSASAPLDWARRKPVLGTTAEEVIAARPRLLLTGNLALGGTNAALQKAGIVLRGYGVPATVQESITQVVDIGEAIGRPSQAQALAQAISAAARPLSKASTQSAIIWQSGGFVPGKGTLQDELLRRAGFRNASLTYGLRQWDVLPMETLIRRPPDIIFMPETASGEDGQNLSARRKLLRHLNGRTRIVAFPDKLLYCGGPSIIAAMQILRGAA